MDGGQSEGGKICWASSGITISLVKGQDGEAVPLNIDKVIQNPKNTEPDDHIETKVNDQNHGLSFFPDQAI